MSHYCRICGRQRSNESFSGKGHRIHVCKKCQKMPKAERRRIEVRDELARFLCQSIISKKNFSRLEELRGDEDEQIAGDAELLLEVANFRPGERRRMKLLLKERPDLLHRLIERDLLHGRLYENVDQLVLSEPITYLHMWDQIMETPSGQPLQQSFEELQEEARREEESWGSWKLSPKASEASDSGEDEIPF